MNVRLPVASGRFYPGTLRGLTNQLNELLDLDKAKVNAKGALMPHAGYVYSGSTAALTISSINLKSNTDTVIFLGPKHTPYGSDISVSDADAWRTPLGDLVVDKDLAKSLLNKTSLESDNAAHEKEHSIEVLLPFFQIFNPDLKIVPIAVNLRSYDKIKELAGEMAAVLKDYPNPPLIVVSSDMSHYVSSQKAMELDGMAIQNMEELDGEKLFNTVISNKISMCGVIPAVLALLILKELGCTKGKLVNYTNSGEVSNDMSSVVGYTGMIFN
ncbi:MAG: AmmeMemoRadiSam system protein B [Deltaproteobacteria bacterium]|nr:AmmeMemoRadiSam system protein B [Deltaproteobacteria bacterium]